MVKKNTKDDLLRKDKVYSKRDTSYSSFWLYNKDGDVMSEDFKDKFVNFYNEVDLLSEFNPQVAKNILSFWSEEGDEVLDPFSGRTRAIVSFAMGRNYVGYEVSQDVTNYMNKRFDEIGLTKLSNFNVRIINKDCIHVEQDIQNESKDLIFSCPPYWNLEKYQHCEGQLSDINKYDEFISELVERLNISANKLKVDKFMCIVIGDFRFKKKYYTLHSDLINALNNNHSLKLHDVIVIQNIPFNSAAYYFGTKKKHKYTAKAHEYLLVWKKVSKETTKIKSKTQEEEFKCKVCGTNKNKYGRFICKDCYTKEYNKKYYLKNADEIKNKSNKYYHESK